MSRHHGQPLRRFVDFGPSTNTVSTPVALIMSTGSATVSTLPHPASSAALTISSATHRGRHRSPTIIDGDLDGDGSPNFLDPDNDNDGTPDSADTDDDNDGILDMVDPDDDNDGIPDTCIEIDTNGDQTSDYTGLQNGGVTGVTIDQRDKAYATAPTSLPPLQPAQEAA